MLHSVKFGPSWTQGLRLFWVRSVYDTLYIWYHTIQNGLSSWDLFFDRVRAAAVRRLIANTDCSSVARHIKLIKLRLQAYKYCL